MLRAAEISQRQNLKGPGYLDHADVLDLGNQFHLHQLNATKDDLREVDVSAPPSDFVAILNGPINADGSFHGFGHIHEGFIVNSSQIRMSPEHHYAHLQVLRDFTLANIASDVAYALSIYLKMTQDEHFACISQLQDYLNDNHERITGRPATGLRLGSGLAQLAREDYRLALEVLDKVMVDLRPTWLDQYNVRQLLQTKRMHDKRYSLALTLQSMHNAWK